MSKPISDIRLYTSRVPNADGHSLPGEFGSTALHIRLRRIAMKLRELDFSLGDFDHMYVNLTPRLPEGEIRLSQRSVLRETAWLRYVDAGVSQTFLSDADDDALISMAARCLMLFAQDESARQMILTAISEAAKGEEMLMCFKAKQSGGIRAVIYLRLLDSGMYHPLLFVYDAKGRERLRIDLPPSMELHALGEINVSRKAVTIRPRKNAYASTLQPLVFPLPENERASDT